MTVPVARAAASKVASKQAAKKVAPPLSPVRKNGKPDSRNQKAVKAVKQTKRAVKATSKKVASGKRSWMPSIRPAKSTVRYRQIIAMECLIGLIIILFNVKPDAEKKDFSDRTHQAAAFLVVFFVLSALTVGGPSMARVSAGLGALIVMTLMFTEMNLGHTAVATMWPFNMGPNGSFKGDPSGGEISGSTPPDIILPLPGGPIVGYPVNPRDGTPPLGQGEK